MQCCGMGNIEKFKGKVAKEDLIACYGTDFMGLLETKRNKTWNLLALKCETKLVHIKKFSQLNLIDKVWINFTFDALEAMNVTMRLVI